MAIIKYDPFKEMERMIDDWDFGFMPAFKKHFAPAMDIYETDKNIVVEIQVSKEEAEKVNVSVEDGVLRVEGGQEKEEEKKDRNYHRKEIRRGHFVRAVSLPPGVKEEEVKAVYENGVLKITVPKAEVKEPKKIEIEVK